MIHKLSYARLIWIILTNKSFRYWFNAVYAYAMNNADEERGAGAAVFSDVEYFVRRDLIVRSKNNQIKRD